MIRRILACTCLWYAGCTSLPTLPPPDPAAQTAWERHRQALTGLTTWQLQGRFALHSDTTHWTGTLTWHQYPDGYRVQLSSPLGQGLIALHSGPAGAELITATGQNYYDDDAESLFAHTIGWDLPLDSLGMWITGQPAQRGDYRYGLTTQGQLAILYQDRWQARYLSYFDDARPPLPRKLNLEGRDLRLKVVVDTWTVPDNISSANPTP